MAKEKNQQIALAVFKEIKDDCKISSSLIIKLLNWLTKKESCYTNLKYCKNDEFLLILEAFNSKVNKSVNLKVTQINKKNIYFSQTFNYQLQQEDNRKNKRRIGYKFQNNVIK